VLAELALHLTPRGGWQCRFLPRHRGEQSVERHVVFRASHLTVTGHACLNTRNQRLGALHALARFVGEHSPEHVDWCAQIRLIPYKKTSQPGITYLDKAEMDALLAAPDRETAHGRRDFALLLFLYNSGARASEAAQLLIRDVDLQGLTVRIIGKGKKQRLCPLWTTTVDQLMPLISGRSQIDP
jgi:site-specific recombinase XerD